MACWGRRSFVHRVVAPAVALAECLCRFILTVAWAAACAGQDSTGIGAGVSQVYARCVESWAGSVKCRVCQPRAVASAKLGAWSSMNSVLPVCRP
jgi:hypothetical protein